MKNKTLSILFSIALFFFILTFSIGLPIYVRPFYYAHIEPMNLEAKSGFTREEIVEAYDEVLDYLTLPGRTFGTGVIPHSDEGADHFADCKVLFSLNAWVLALSSAALIAFLILKLTKKITLPSLLGFRPSFWSALCAIVLPLVLGGLAAINFDRAFEIFHAIFFPGKTNWLFDPRTDPIILAMPQDFFMHCAILIAAGVLTLSLIFLIRGIVGREQRGQRGRSEPS